MERHLGRKIRLRIQNNKRQHGIPRTWGHGWKVSTISFGAWGDVKDEESLAALRRALDLLQLHSPPTEVFYITQM